MRNPFKFHPDPEDSEEDQYRKKRGHEMNMETFWGVVGASGILFFVYKILPEIYRLFI